MEKIPHIIHYCWFGGNEKPELVHRCIASWREHLPDWEIREWNEGNYDISRFRFTQEAYDHKKWAFVADVARFDILSQYGGVYFDTDVELLNPIPEAILSHQAFTGVESAGNVSPGLVFASVPGFHFLETLLENYRKSSFVQEGKVNLKTVNSYTTELLEKRGFIKNNQYQVIDGLAIYPAEVFCGYDQDVHEICITSETISVHHYANTWSKKTMKVRMRNFLKATFGVEFYRKLLVVKRKVTGKIS